MFCSKAILLALLPLAVSALPQQKRAPVPDFGDVIGSVFNDATSGAASVFGDATSAFVAATSDVGSVVDSALAEATATSIYEDVSKAFGTATSQAFATIITSNGVPIVEVTSVGGPAITLATQSGVTTSFAGHTFTVVPSSSSSSTSSSASATHNAAMGIRPWTLSTGSFVGAAGVVGSVLLGALVVV
ncbi:hypothetical protein EW026_g6031 [Hermanssonia centrifuga]|uniref:Uncharacterized protein n=1 Tax=Hermanssonia centrifuga TaxID=98765 RepID=A0A4V3X9V2_9APHY|nr:hypothetical protein EW026_g6031 [Hermanssonia centrifuga]